MKKNKQCQRYKNKHLWENDDKYSIAITYYSYDDDDDDDDDDVIIMIMLAAAVICCNLHILSKQKWFLALKRKNCCYELHKFKRLGATLETHKKKYKPKIEELVKKKMESKLLYSSV